MERFARFRFALLLALLLGSLPLTIEMHAALADDRAAMPMFRGSPARTGEQPGPGPTSSPKVLWRFQTGRPATNLIDGSTPFPVVPIAPDIYSSPAVVNGVVYVGSSDGNLYAIDANTGQQQWCFGVSHPQGTNLGQGVYSSPTVDDGVIYIGGMGGDFDALDATTGKLVWHQLVTDFPNAVAPESPDAADAIVSSPLVINDVVYLARGATDPEGNSHSSSAVTMLDSKNGQRKGGVVTGGAIQSSPAFANGMIYVGSADGFLYAFRSGSGKLVWQFGARAIIKSTPAVANGTVYFGSEDRASRMDRLHSRSIFYAIDATNGEERWGYVADGIFDSSPAVANGVVFVGNDNGNIYALDASTGDERWHATTGGPVRSSPAISGGVVYVGSEDGYLYAFDATTGKQLWRFRTYDAIMSSPAVVGGVIYVGSEDGSLWAIGSPTQGGAGAPATPIAQLNHPTACLDSNSGS